MQHNDLSRRALLRAGGGLGFVGALGLAGSSKNSAAASTASRPITSLRFDSGAWSHDAKNDVYYQIRRTYVARPQATDYETLAVFVPGKYFTGTRNSDGTYTVRTTRTKVGGFTAATAPIVFPVNTPGYAAQKSLTAYSYSDISSYMKAGFVYVHAGLRGRDSETSSYTGNAPWGVVDLKSAIRYVRYNADLIPGDKKSVFVFGHSGGGAQSAVTGASGDSELYFPYLRALGAAMTDTHGRRISDAVAGAMCWCPITTLDYADAAYEWNMGQFSTSGTRARGKWTAAYSADLADAFARYQNGLGLHDASGRRLTLKKSAKGHYLAGSYYNHLISVIQDSLNDFLSYTTFPYTPSDETMPGMGGNGAPSGRKKPTGSGGTPPGGKKSKPTTYKTVQAYIAHLNSSSTWVRYDASTKRATVLSLEGFVKSQKEASKDVGAFDGVSRQETENVVMGKGTAGLHFSPVASAVIGANQKRYAKLTGWKSTYGASAYTSDFATKDGTGKDVAWRLNMYNPMYYVSQRYPGYGRSTVAPHWRIRTGIMQGDTASTTEINLALALANLGRKKVDFATVWGMGHTMAETTGNATTNFISWVTESVR